MADALSEIQIQTLFRSRARIQCPRVSIVAIPNAGKRTRWAAQQAKREGLATGFPDVMCLAPGLVGFIEFKASKGRLSEAQGEWLDRLSAMGFPCSVSRDPDHAIGLLREWGFPFLGDARPIGQIVAPIISDFLDRASIA